VEDSHNGLLPAKASGVRTIPNPQYPPGYEEIEASDAVPDSIEELTPAVVEE
jgi:beta-phosphoglucomutase-like phosphatase (HAD superfamily)